MGGFVLWPKDCTAASGVDKTFVQLGIMLAQLRVEKCKKLPYLKKFGQLEGSFYKNYAAATMTDS